MSFLTTVFAGIALAVIFHYSLAGVQVNAAAIATTPAPIEKSCSESNITIDQVQFQHVWDVNGLANYMTRLDQWKPFIDLETKDVRFKNGVIGGYWNFQIVRNLATGSRLTLCAVHTPDQRRPNPHDRNFFFEFKVLVSLIPPPEQGANADGLAPEVDVGSTTTPESIASPTTTQPQTQQPGSSSPTASSSTTTTTTATSTAAPSTSAASDPEPSVPAFDAPQILFDEGVADPFTNSIQQRSFGGAGFQRLMNATAAAAQMPLMLQFTPLGLPVQHRLPAPLFTPPTFMGRDLGSPSVASNVTLTAPTFQQSPISPKTHFTFWDFETKTLQLIRSKYRNGQQVPKDTKIILTFTMTELIVEKPHTGRKTCA